MTDQDRAAQAWDVWERAWVTWNEAANKADPECNTKAVEILATYGQEQFRAGVDKFQEWSDVAFYPGPNENPHFQAGYMEAVHEVGRIAYRLLAEQEEKE